MMDILERISTRVKMICGKAIVKAAVDSGQLQLVKIAGLDGETQDGIERIQNFGFTSNPPVGSEAVVVYLNGNRDHGVVIACDNGTLRHTGLLSGESAQYSQFGQLIHLKSDGTVSITSTGGVDVGAGSVPVAMSSQVAAMWNILKSVCSAFTPPGTPDGGAALSSAIATAIEASGINFESTNLRAD